MNLEERFHLEDTVDSSIGLALVDTALLPTGKYETMMFKVKKGKVDYSNEVDVAVSYTEESARAAHEAMIQKWKV